MHVHVRVPVRLSDGMPCIHGEKLDENQQKQGTNCAHRSREWLMQMSMSHREHHKRLFHGAPLLKRNSHHYIAEIFTRATVSTQLPLAKGVCEFYFTLSSHCAAFAPCFCSWSSHFRLLRRRRKCRESLR